MTATRQHIFGAGQPLPPDFGVGKWSRIATFGRKAQQQLDGKMREWEFTPDLFKQAVVNYLRMFSQRRLGSDYEHQARFAPINGRPAPNLCYWDGMAVIQGDQVLAVEEQQSGPRPDPALLRALLAERFPNADPDPSGLWTRCGEVTDLGRLLIPSYEQLSPMFSEAQLDETGEEIGFAVSNISFVNVAHQDGTFFNFSAIDGQLHPSGPERRTGMTEQELMGKLGLADGCAKDELSAKFAEYQDSTSDPKEMRAAMRAAFGAKMKAFEGTPAAKPFEGKESPAEEEAEKKAEQAAMSAQQQALATLSAQHQQTNAELAQLRTWKQQQEQSAYEGRVATFADNSIRAGQWDASKRADLVALAKDTKEESWPRLVSAIPAGTFSGRQRMFPGGNPAGTPRPGAGFNPPYAVGQKTIGFSATQQAFALLEQRGVKSPDAQQLAGALREVGHQNPDSLRAALGPSSSY